MSREIDERIVEMTFDNQQFERGVKTTLGTLDKLKKSLKFDGAADGLEGIQNAVNRIDFSNVISGSAAAIAKFTVISNMVTKIQNQAEAMVKSLTIDPVKAGWSKYADITSSTQTIMSATAKDFENEEEQIKVVTEQLAKLNWFTDETSYSLTDMTNNIGKFTSNGVKLETAVTAMEGISTWAAKSGANVNEASRAMYNLSQALATGSVKLIDWKSIENANMATAEFKEQVIDTAVELGTLIRGLDGTIYTLGDNEVSVTNFNEHLKDEWFTSDVLLKVLNRYGSFTDKLQGYMDELNFDTTSQLLDLIDKFKEGMTDGDFNDAVKEAGVSAERLKEILEDLGSSEYDLGRKSFRAAQEAKTFQEAIDATKDAVSTGWMNTFQLIFGNYLEAKKIWTRLANELWDVFAAPGERRNSILEAWIAGEGRTNLFKAIDNLWKPIIDSIHLFRDLKEEFFPAEELGKSLAKLTKRFENFTSKLKMNEELVSRVSKTVFRLVNSVKNLVSPVGTLISKLSGTKLGGFLTKLTGLILFKNKFGLLATALVAFSDKISIVFEKLSSGFSKVANSKIGKWVDFFADKFNKLRVIFIGWWNHLTSLKLPDWAQNIVNWFTDLFAPVEEVAEVADAVEENVDRIETAYKSIKDMVLEVIRGDWGNGVDRDNALWAAGYDNDRIQDVVNQVWSLQGAWKEGYEEILESYANTSALMEGVTVAGDPKEQKKQARVLLKTKKIVADLGEAMTTVTDAYNDGMGDEKKQKKVVLSLKKQSQLMTNLGDKEPPKTFLQLLSDAGHKFIEKLPSLLTKIGAAAAKLKIKMTELGTAINNKLGAALTKVINFYKKYEPDIKNFLTTLWEKIKNLGSVLKTNLGTGWERVKTIFEGVGPVFEKFFVSLLHFDTKGMGAAIHEFFEIIGGNIKSGVEAALGLGEEGLEKIGGLFNNTFNTIMAVFGGKEFENPEEAFGILLPAYNLANEITSVTTELTGATEEAAENLPGESVLEKIQGYISGFLGLAQSGASTVTIFRLGTLFKGLGKAGSSLADFLDILDGQGAGNIFKRLKSMITGRSTKNMFQDVRDILFGIAAVGFAVVAVGSLPKESFDQGVDAFKQIIEGIVGIIVTLLGGELGRFGIGFLEKTLGVGGGSISEKFEGIAKAMFAIAAACAILFFAVYEFGTMAQNNEDALETGLWDVTVVMGLLTGVITALSKWGGNSIEFKGIAATIFALAVAIGIICLAVYGFAGLKEGVQQGVGAVVIIMVALIGMITLLARVSKGSLILKGVAGTLIALSITIGVLFFAVAGFALYKDPTKLIQGIGGVVALLIALGFAVYLINKGAADWAGTIPKLASLVVIAIALGALCWAINKWPVNIMQAVSIDLIMGALISFMAAFPKLSQGFKDIKGAATAGFGVGLSVSAIIGTITATIGLINEIDTLIEEQSGGTRGFKALAKKVGDCIETVGTSIGNAVTSIKTAIGGETAKELVAGQTAAETLKSIIETVAAMYTSHSDFDLFVAWATGGDVTPGTLLEEAFTKLGPGITALVTSVKDLTKADVSKINLLVPFMNSIGQILIDPAMITDILYFMDSVNNLILRLGDINTDSIDSFEKAMGHLADLLTTGITDENAENTGNVLSDALIDFVVYGLQVMADEFNPDLSHDAKERYSDSARNLNLGLQSAIDNVRAGLEFKAKQIPRWIADAINTQISLVTSAGLNMMLGFKNGMVSGASEVYAVAHSVALKAADRMRVTLQERSPSRLTTQIGEYASLGLANGLLNEQSTVEKSAFSVVDGMRSVMTMAGEALSDDLGPVIAPVLDLTNVSRGAGAIGGMFGNPILNPSLSIANAKAITMNSVSPNNGYSDTSGQNGYQSIAAEMTNIRGDLDRLNSTIAGMQVVMDSGALVGSIAPRMDNALAQRVGHAARRN